MHEAIAENVLMILRSIWFAMGSSAHPYLARQLSTKDARQSTEGYAHDGRLFGRDARDKKLDGNRDTRHKIYTGLGHQYDVKPYVLCSVGLYCWNTRLDVGYRLGDPCPSYSLEG